MKSKSFIFSALVVIGIAGSVIWVIINDYTERSNNMAVTAATSTETVMFKNAGCQCCDKWASYLDDHGYDISVRPVNNMPAIKAKHHIPRDMESCHTLLLDGYAIEGHVPAEDIRRLLKERPEAVGISAPGMPSSAPGMNTSLNDPYDVYLIGRDGTSRIYARH